MVGKMSLEILVGLVGALIGSLSSSLVIIKWFANVQYKRNELEFRVRELEQNMSELKGTLLTMKDEVHQIYVQLGVITTKLEQVTCTPNSSN